MYRIMRSAINLLAIENCEIPRSVTNVGSLPVSAQLRLTAKVYSTQQHLNALDHNLEVWHGPFACSLHKCIL
jgi:hypothetical protein